ncbi:anhydro-N-acetylmuramic acid kinase [Thalassotalea sp. PS06]|uniref:anhydro-N-acetylmuramic acid kinase n=1 Tax=Thalassotalea sp. PS06 TaxID=2594005 RepID=UPI0011638967|nr:anhydro-N-acetylmuramic acid kinase [Thalassotalea sp. PS06]QDP00258.1 anhydro-N-acetylmuramic acid kinase [Thalassotalea sp. PS06]
MSAKNQSPNNQTSLYIGLMSGTSADGIDLALVDFAHSQPQLIASYFTPYSKEIREQITSLYVPGDNEIDRAGSLDKALAVYFSNAINEFLVQQNLTASDICAIANHGQTIRHRPEGKTPFTLQIGCNQTLACQTGIRVIGQFRQKDMALGGQGAPLVPAYHQAIFHRDNANVCVINIGGISNITFLPAHSEQDICGFDIGPGNALLDDWYRQHNPDCSHGIDINSDWANQGNVIAELLKIFKRDPFFALPYPKSTGREYFQMDWLNERLAEFTSGAMENAPQDIQATLLALTCETIADTVLELSSSGEVIICGGGANNQRLLDALAQLLPKHQVMNSSDKGVDNETLEAEVFAWLGRQFDLKLPSNLPCVTGASKAVPLGIEYLP